ncbi:MAG: hypothetical protein PVF17_10310, partial [Ignavibacteria bacterium]
MDNNKKKDGWDKFLIIFQIISWLAIPTVITIVGSNIESTIKEREIKLKYVELAINILRDEPNVDNKNVRKYAIDILSKYSEIPITAELKKSLETKPLVKGRFITDDQGVIPTDDSGVT